MSDDNRPRRPRPIIHPWASPAAAYGGPPPPDAGDTLYVLDPAAPIQPRIPSPEEIRRFVWESHHLRPIEPEPAPVPDLSGMVRRSIDQAMRSPAVIAAALMRLSSSARDTVRVLLDALEADGAGGDPGQQQIVRAIIEFADGSRQSVEFTRREPSAGEGG